MLVKVTTTGFFLFETVYRAIVTINFLLCMNRYQLGRPQESSLPMGEAFLDAVALWWAFPQRQKVDTSKSMRHSTAMQRHTEHLRLQRAMPLFPWSTPALYNLIGQVFGILLHISVQIPLKSYFRVSFAPIYRLQRAFLRL